MKKIFLSLPMSGRSNKEIRAQIEQMKMEFLLKNPLDKGELIEFVDNTDCPPIDSRDTVTPNLLYLGEAIRKLAYCDYVYFGKGWSKARGCLIEMEICKKYDIPYFINKNDGVILMRSGEIWKE